MNYLIVCHSDNKYFIILSHDNQLRGYRTKEEIMNAFSGYTEGWTGQGVERSASCTIGMLQMQPVAIAAPDNPKDLEKYIVSLTPWKIWGGAIGRGYMGVQVKEEILELKQFSIWKESMIKAGIA